MQHSRIAIRFGMPRSFLILAAFFAGFLPTLAEAAAPVIEPQTPQALSDSDMAEIVDFIVGNAVFALYHQAGHMMSERYDAWPPGEREADRFAVLTLLEPRSGAGDQTLVDAIDSWQIASHHARAGFETGVLPDRHSLDGSRAGGIICDMVGADPIGFSDIADASRLTPEQRTACGDAYRRDLAAARASLARLVRPAGTEGEPLAVAYDPPLGGDIAEATILADNGVLEEVAAKLGSAYAFPEPPLVRAANCGEPTSKYDAERNELVLCYELSAFHGQLILRDIESRS